MNKVTIQIIGEVNSGKSNIAYVVKEHLKKLGFNVTITDANFPNEREFDVSIGRHSTAAIMALRYKTDIDIHTITTIKK